MELNEKRREVLRRILFDHFPEEGVTEEAIAGLWGHLLERLQAVAEARLTEFATNDVMRRLLREEYERLGDGADEEKLADAIMRRLFADSPT